MRSGKVGVGDIGTDNARRPIFRRRKSCPLSGTAAPKIDYKDVKLLQRFVSERGKIVPSRITQVGEKLQTVCHNMQIGFATAGSGNGGCVWALAQEPEQITELTEQWQNALADVPTAQILDVAIDPQGLKVEQINP